MKIAYRFFQCIILLGLAAFLSEQLISGRLSYYIHLRFSPLTFLVIIGFSTMAVLGVLDLYQFSQKMRPGIADRPMNQLPTIIVTLLPVCLALLGFSVNTIAVAFFLVFIVLAVQCLLPLMNITQNTASFSLPNGTLILVIIPLILGILVPKQPLSTAALNSRGMNFSAPLNRTTKAQNIAQDDSEKRTILDWIKIFNFEEKLTPFIGQKADVVGFVYHDSRLKEGQFMVGRFIITCCVADAFATGLVVKPNDQLNLTDGTWIQVKGTIDEMTLDGQKIPMILVSSLTPSDPPEQPYLYP
jgi:uncharacterized repeat protein (TIGR03943 family)